MNNIYNLITTSRVEYSQPIELEEGWNWSMKEHLRRSFLYINSQFEQQNDNRDLRPNKNIVLPILNIQFRTEGFDVKNIEIYVDNSETYYKSFLVKKYHDKWALENKIDTFIDDAVEEYCTFGGVLVRKTGESRPEVVPLRNLEFCNQRNILENTFCIKHCMSQSQLRGMKKWGLSQYGATHSIEDVIYLAKRENKKEIEIFEVHGTLPSEWIMDNSADEIDLKEKDIQQIQIVSFYKDENGEDKGITLFKHAEPELPFKYLSRDKVEGRAVGRGGVEELFDPQIWTNWNEVKITEMLDSASKTLHWSDDIQFKTKNNLSKAKNNQVFQLQEGKKISQIDTYPRNIAVFNDSLGRWYDTAQVIGSAEGLSGAEPSSGAPFKLFEARTVQAGGTHKYRQGKIATFMDEIYRDWIIPYLGKEISKEQIFMEELTSDEMQEISDVISENKANKARVEQVLNGEVPQEMEVLKNSGIKEFIKGGNKKFFKILKDEMSGEKLSARTNIAGKQKDLALMTDKVVNIMREYIANPQIRQDPGMTKLLNVILESSGLSPINFTPAPMENLQPEQGGKMQLNPNQLSQQPV